MPTLPASPCSCPGCQDGPRQGDAATSSLPVGERLVQQAGPHLGRMQAAARRILGCDHLAADAVQEAMLSLWQLTTPPVDLPGWLLRAVVHRSLHQRRSLQRRIRHEQHAATAACALHDGCDNPLHRAWAHELDDRLAQALATLPRDQGRAFVLFQRDGLDYDAIATRLAVPVGTVRSRLHRARAALQREFAALVEPDGRERHSA